MQVNKKIAKRESGVVYLFMLILPLFEILFFASPVYAQFDQTYILLNDTYSSVYLSFTENTSSHEFYITLPRGNVDSASLSFTGVATAGVRNVSADVVIVTDVSGSMAGAKIQSAREADYLFVNTVDTQYITIGLVKYSTCPTYNLDVLPITNNKTRLNNTISTYVASGSTNICKGLMLAINELELAARTTNLNILLMTDGQANYYYNESTDRCISSTTRAMQCTRDMAARAASLGIKVYAIGFGTGADMTLLGQVAAITGGEAHYAPTGEQLKELYESIALEISAASYIVPNVSDGAWLANQSFSGNATWTDANCGWMGANCVNFKEWLQQQLDACTTQFCRVNFTISSPSYGDLIVSDLSINTSPKGSITCEQNTPEYLLQPDTSLRIPLEDVFVFDGEIGAVNAIQVINSTGVIVREDSPLWINVTNNGLNGTKAVYLRLSTNQSITSSLCPVIFSTNETLFGNITCKYPSQEYILSSSPRTVPLTNIFEFNGYSGEPVSLFVDSAVDVNITSGLPNNIIIEREKESLSETARVRIQTNRGVYSPSCAVDFLSIYSRCGQAQCQPLISAGDIEGLINNGCTDGQLRVVNPSWVSLHRLYPELNVLEQYTVNSFTSINPPGGYFIIDPSSGNKFVVFSITGPSLLDGDTGIGVIRFYIDNPNEIYTYCPILIKSSFEPQIATDIETDLLVTGSRAVLGYRDQYGQIIAQGPFIFTAKVWLRK